MLFLAQTSLGRNRFRGNNFASGEEDFVNIDIRGRGGQARRIFNLKFFGTKVCVLGALILLAKLFPPTQGLFWLPVGIFWELM